MDTSKCRLTLPVCLPRLHDGARNGLPASGEHAPLNKHMLAYSLRRDRLAEQDCKCKRRAVRTCEVEVLRDLRTIWCILGEKRA
jgi:hypothetical protein